MKETFNIIDCGNYITIANINGEYKNHCHINKGSKKKQYDAANTLIRIMRNKRIPRSKYFRECILRISLDKKYKKRIRDKINNRQHYININKGVRR